MSPNFSFVLRFWPGQKTKRPSNVERLDVLRSSFPGIFQKVRSNFTQSTRLTICKHGKHYVHKFICICIIVIFFFFGDISSCSHLCPKRRVGWAQFDRRGHVAGGLGAIRAVCRA